MFDDHPVFRTQEEIEAHRREVAAQRESNWVWAVGLVAAFVLIIAAFPVKNGRPAHSCHVYHQDRICH